MVRYRLSVSHDVRLNDGCCLDRVVLREASGDAAGTGAKDAQTILDDLSNSATVVPPSAAEALSNAQGTCLA